MNIDHAVEQKRQWEARNFARAQARKTIERNALESRETITAVLREHGVQAPGLVSRIFRRRKLTATQAYALPHVYAS